jgi:hypothetical protein
MRGLRRRSAVWSEDGQISLLILGLAVVVVLLVVGTIDVTSVELSRMRLLDAADAAALDAADALDPAAYCAWLADAVVLSDDSVRQSANAYLGAQPRPESIRQWALTPGTGSPDGWTAVVGLTGASELPLGGGLLRALGVSVTISVESRARAPIQ